MADLRQNPVTGRWVVVAPARSGRPLQDEWDDDAEAPGPDQSGRRDPDCPFCPGNEAKLPEIVWELPDAEEPGWRCRAVPNRYPAFAEATGPSTATPEPRLLREDPEDAVSVGKSYPALGHQEVLIESPRHDRDPADMSLDELRAMVELYRERLDAVIRRAPHLFPSLFRNQGSAAGASLLHPHAQLIATRAAGPARRIREDRLVRYASEADDCLLCGLTDLEPEGERRVVEEDAFHRVYVPWAAERPLEVWVLPKRHRSSFSDADPEELESLARMLGRTLRRIRILGDSPDYNYMLHTTAGARDREPGLHWFLRIRPVTARMAGFELDTGIVINPESPGDEAERLRGVDVGLDRGGKA